NGGVFDMEFFVRKELLTYGNAVFSVQPLIRTPCVFVLDTGEIKSNKYFDSELRGLAGHSFQWNPSLFGIRPLSDQYHFINLETAYRKRLKPFADQVRIDGTLGIRMSEKV